MNGGVSPSGYYEHFNTNGNTISISEGGNSCGYVQYNRVPFWSGGHCFTLHIKENHIISTMYLFHYLKWKESEIMALRIGTGLPNIQKKDLSRLCIVVPSLRKQEQLISLLETFQKKFDNEDNFAALIDQQKNYMLSHLFI